MTFIYFRTVSCYIITDTNIKVQFFRGAYMSCS